MAAKLLGIDENKMANALTNRVAGIRGLTIALRAEDTQNARDGLAKVIYDRLFELLVTTINNAIPASNKSTYIGLLDIAGFEQFDVNSFEQFCINYCNEKLQQFFNDRILKEEQVVYQREGLYVRTVTYIDNQDCIDLIEQKKTGILALLDEENRLPQCNSEHFTNEVHRVHGESPRLMVPRKSKHFKHLRDDEGFLLQHFAGPVCYTTTEFIAKNNDALHSSLEELLHASTNDLLRKMHNPSETKTWTLKKLQTNIAGKINFISVGSKFRDQLNSLIVKLRSTGTNFIRCVKPNSNMAAHEFEGMPCLQQLRFFGLTDVLVLMQQGFPSRTQFSNLYEAYKPLLTQDLRSLDPRMFFKALFHAVGMSDNDFKFGVSKIFFRAGKFAEFDDLLRLDPENLNQMVTRVRKWILGYRWRRAIYAVLCGVKLKKKIIYRANALVTIQRFIRGWLVRRRVTYMIRVSRELKTLEKELEDIKTAYGALPEFQSQGRANIERVQSSLKELQRSLHSGELAIPQDLRTTFERLQVDAAAVNVDFDSHKKLKEATDAERRLREKAEAEATAELERQRRESEQVQLRRPREDLLIELGDVGELNYAAPSNDIGMNGRPESVYSQVNGYMTASGTTPINYPLDEDLNMALLILKEKLPDMCFKELKSYLENAKFDEEKRLCEKEINRRYLALQDFKDTKRTSSYKANGHTSPSGQNTD